jgi:hypothetical protein
MAKSKSVKAASKSRRPAPEPQSGRSRKNTRRKKASSSKAAPPLDKCFVISPFGGWHDEYFTAIFCPAIKAAGLEPARADDLFRSSNIVHDIWHLVVTSRVLLADLTDKNPNVFYELGLAHAARKPVLLLTQSMDDVPFDLRALRIIEYDVEHPSWGQVLRENIKQGLNETLESPERSVLPTFLAEEPDGRPEVSTEEARLISLQQQMDSLRAEIRASGDGPDIRPLEANALIDRLVEEGTPRGVIVNRVSRLGAPKPWIRRQLDMRSPRGSD